MLELFSYSENSPLLFTQSAFWLFFGVIMVAYLFLHGRVEARNRLLLVASLYFYYLSSGFYFLLLVFSTFVDYYIGGAIYRSNSPTKRKRLVTLSVVINLTLLAYFKYTFFFADGVNTLFDTELEVTNFLAAFMNVFGANMDTSNIFLPIGISFYTFQTISYSVDIYRGQLKPVRNIYDFGLFVSFFPQLVAGPIVRASEFIPQIYNKFSLSKEAYGRALFLIMVGLFKKIYISDYISINFVDRVFESPLSFSGFENLMASYGYAIQIYCDFSGYTDIAIGVALLLGFQLPLNFDSPYKSTSITEFWRRWHISLSSFLRDYLYIPLGGNRKGKIRTYVNLALTMLLGGLWHGAHIRFIIWGALHGLALAFHKIWMEKTGSKHKKKSFGRQVVMGVITFHFVTFCWIFFRASDMRAVEGVLMQITTNFNFEVIPQVVTAYWKVFFVLLVGFVTHLAPYSWKNWLREEFTTMPTIVKASLLVLLVFVLFQSRSSEIQPFIYFQF
ncbi:MBOAT family O-acyltransferase [Limibacter armeniacum]|uniref:MBOAT family O-acyltransferase n=1 Tax=Limibacter armeniacum TaxID=466084 RepID=UPI002FE54D4B